MPFINDKLNHYETNGEEKKPVTKDAGSRYRFDVAHVMDKLQSRIFGQEHVMANMEDMLSLVKADISDTTRPLYTGLFLGPTGVGKTEVVRIVAESIYGEADRFCRIDMNTLSTEHYSAALTGAPPGYVGSKEGTTLFNKEYIEGTYSKPGIVLFDEIEKADHEVILTLLNVFDHGRLRVTSGQVDLDFTNTIVFMTSNLASKDILQHADQTSDEVKRIVQEKLEETFLPEFINRIDDILQFNRLETDVAKQIVNMYTADLNARLKRHNSSVSLEAPFVTRLIDEGYDAKYGARALKRSFRRSVEVPLAKRLVAGESGEFLGREREITIKNTSINQ